MKQNIKLIDSLLWLSVVALLAVALFATYNINISTPLKIIVWIAWALLSSGLLYFTTQGKQALSFAKEAKIELQKVFWPTRQETVQTTSIVMIMVTVTGFVLWLVDTLMIWFIAKITHLG